MPVLGLAGCHWRKTGKLQVRFHRNIAASSLAADCNVPQRPPAKLEVLHLYRWFTHTQSFTHSFVRDNLSHTTLSLTTFHTQPFHRHTTFSHKTLHIERELLKWLTLHHLLCLFFFLPATATTFSDYWKKLTCGVIRSFYFSTSQCPKIHISQHVPTPTTYRSPMNLK